ncbi:MAG TPA: ABC transporter ATP-binding protein [Kiritimatiellia bacterium]|nr:ABC transporter ATP-binding protein [Kiritimatiellia bacterium]
MSSHSSNDGPSLIRYILRHFRLFWLGTTYALLRCLIIAPCPWIFQQIIDKKIPAGDYRGIGILALIFMSLLFIHYFFAVGGAMEIARKMAKLMLMLRADIFNKLHYLNFAYLDRQKAGRLLSKYAFDTQKIEATMTQLMNQFLPNALYSLSISALLVYLNWQLSFVLIFMVPLFAIIRYCFHNKLKRHNEATRLSQEKLTGTASEVITALRLVRSLGEERQVTNNLNQHSGEFAESRLALTRISFKFSTVMYLSSQFFMLLTVGGGAVLVIHGNMTLGTMLAFMAGLPIIMMPIHLFASMGEQYFAGQESYRSVSELLDSTYVEEWHGQMKAERLEGRIQYDNVSFMYEGGTRPVLEKFNLSVQPGEHIALVGPSGSGKSTLAALLLGLYKPVGGRILIDGVSQEDWDMRWLRKQTAIVLQESLILSGSVADNIRFAKPDATDDEVREAARQAFAHDFIMEMPSQYETLVGERGVMLSGGQRQRLSIARAILRDPRILILDEATSALDYASEMYIQQAMRRLAVNRTMITIAHRLSTIRDADRIVVLNNGTIMEEGGYEQLVAARGYFAELLNMQSRQSEANNVLVI